MNARKLVPAAAAVLVLAGCADDDGVGAVQPDEITSSPVVPVDASAELTDPEGSVLGTAQFTDQANGVQVEVDVHGMSPGAHPLRLYDGGECDPAPGTGQVGELPPVQVTDTGVGSLGTLVGSVDLADLLAGDGTALVVEATSGEPADSSASSSASSSPGTAAGSRIACGVIGR